MNWINLICIGFFIVCVFFTTQETFANGVVENFSEEFFFEEEIFTEVNKKDFSATYASINTESENNLIQSKEQVIDLKMPDPLISKIYKRDKIDPVEAPSHKTMKKPNGFRELKPTKGESIDKPPLSPHTLQRMYGISESTSTTTEYSATSTPESTEEDFLEIEEEQIDEILSSSTASSTIEISQEFSEVINLDNSTITSSASLDSPENNTNSTTTEDHSSLDSLQVFNKPKELVDEIEDIFSNE